MAVERKDSVIFAGQSMTLVGPQLKVGDKAPDAQLMDEAMVSRKLSDYKSKVRIISSVVSLDTGVCAAETKRFSEEVSKFGDAVVLITISRDLPFAQARFCEDSFPPNAIFLSDYARGAFGQAYGTFIKEMSLDSRAVFVVGKQNQIVHAQYVKETGSHPDYGAVLEAVRKELEKK